MLLKGGSANFDSEEQITDAWTVRFYLDRNRCTPKEKKFCKKYKSPDKYGFDVGQILKLVHCTYWKAVEEIWDGDAGCINNLVVMSFVFDSDTNSVFPITDSLDDYICVRVPQPPSPLKNTRSLAAYAYSY